MKTLTFNKKIILGFILLIFLPEVGFSQIVLSWLTNADKNNLLQQQESVSFTNPTNSNRITISNNTTYQTIDGFGFTMTEGSAEVISGLTADKQDQLLNELFNTKTGLGISVLRISIGASDLSNSCYSYDDVAGDTDLSGFNLAGPDLTYLIPVIKKALAINPDIKILATPWSAPKWMKTNKAWIGGSLSSNYYEVYSQYFIKYFDAMKEQGIDIWAITPQNEPENGNNEPSMLMTSTEEINFINNYLGLAMKKTGYSNIKIIGFDHNCDNTAYPIEVCKSSVYVDGAAFHLYAGDISAMSTVHNSTNKNVYFTEQYTGTGGDFSGDMTWHISNVMIGSMKNWSKTAIEWNIATNTSYGPHTLGGCNTCLGAITINSTSSYTKNVSYYIVGHMTKVIKPGAIRIEAATTNSGLENVAFQNTDGSIALVVLNNSGSSKTFDVYYAGKAFPYTLKNNSVASFTWKTEIQALALMNLDKVTITPNPSNNYIEFNNLKIDMKLNIYSMLGDLIITKELNGASKNIIDISIIEDGVYLARLNADNDFLIGKIIKN